MYEKHLDPIFTKVLEKFIDNKDELLETIITDYKNLIKESNLSFDNDSLVSKLKEQKQLKNRLIEMSMRNLIDDTDFLEQKSKIDDQIKNINFELFKLKSNDNISYYEKKTNIIRKELISKMDIRKNISKYFNLFIDKVFVSKINNDRKHIKLEIIFAFDNKKQEIEINYNDKDINSKTNMIYKSILDVNSSYLIQKYLLTKLEININKMIEEHQNGSSYNLNQKSLLFNTNKSGFC